MFFSKTSQEVLGKLTYPPESASMVLGRIEGNFIRVDAIVPFEMPSQSEGRCIISVSEKLNNNAIGILHTHPHDEILPSDKDIETVSQIFPKRKAVIFMTEKKSGSWLINPFLLKNNKLTMLESVII